MRLMCLSAGKNYKSDKRIDDFIYRLMGQYKPTDKFIETEYTYRIVVNDVEYQIWCTNYPYAFMSRGGKSGRHYDLWDNRMPSYKCMADFRNFANKYAVDENEQALNILNTLP